MKFDLINKHNSLLTEEQFFLIVGENSRQSTRHAHFVHLLSWRPSELLFNDIIADRIGVIHGIRCSSTESKIFATFCSIFINIILEFSTALVVRW